MIPFAEPAVEQIFASYSDEARSRMFALRDLIFTTAQGMGIEGELVETLKWGEPSYTCPRGSTLRVHWRADDPGHYRVFFNCQTKLVPTFRDLFRDDFNFEGNRAIRLGIASDPDLCALSKCIEMSLSYHSIKDLPNLGWSV